MCGARSHTSLLSGTMYLTGGIFYGTEKAYGHINDSTTELTGYIFDVGDVNKDGVINAKDKKQIFGHINGTSLWS